MPILGSTDSAAFGNTVAVTQNSATVTKNTNDTIAGGDIIVLDSVQYFVNSVDGNTCLLYTSPSPRDVEESRMPSSA